MIFRRARLRLTVLIGVVQLALFTGFGAGVYTYVRQSFDYDPADGSAATTAEAGFVALRQGILLALLAVALLTPLTSWIIAGLVLRPAREAYDAQQRFVDDASHELRTPLTALQGRLALALAHPRDAAAYVAALADMRASAERLRTTLDDLLWLSRGEREALAFRAVPLADVVREAVAECGADAARMRVLAASDVVVVGSASLLSRAIGNVLANAARYSSGEVRVVVGVAHGRGRVITSDAGVGMTAEQRLHAFDRFWRADYRRPGSGLGLSIVQQIVRLHRGTVEIRSTPGVGTAVEIALPLSRSRHAPLRTVAAARRSSRRTRSEEP